jgi:endonuclease III
MDPPEIRPTPDPGASQGALGHRRRRLPDRGDIGSSSNRTEKRPHDIDAMLSRIAKAVRPFPKAALFELAEEGFDSPFEQLMACIISVRTLDETTLPVARRLFAQARTPAEVRELAVDELERLLRPAMFRDAKARNIAAIARRVCEEYGGELPCDEATLLSLPGVGPKCAHLVLGIACGQPSIAVDVHVHRVTNRWGYVATKTPEQTMATLEGKLPHRHWVDINRLLIPFGKHVCVGRLPHCSTCPVLEYCEQIAVTTHR